MLLLNTKRHHNLGGLIFTFQKRSLSSSYACMYNRLLKLTYLLHCFHIRMYAYSSNQTKPTNPQQEPSSMSKLHAIIICLVK